MLMLMFDVIFQAPSVESVILCNSKGYTRKLIIPEDHNIKYKIIPFSAGTDIDVDEIVDSVGFPLILKPACGWESNLIQKCDNKVQLIEVTSKTLYSIQTFIKLN